MKCKRFFFLFLLFAVLAELLPFRVSAAGAGLTGPKTVHAGDNITLTLSANNCSGVLGAEGQISYDSSVLTLVSGPVSQRSGWSLAYANNWFTAYDLAQSSPVNGSAALFTLTFRVNPKAAAGTSIWVNVSNLVLSDDANSSQTSASYSAVVAAPVSSFPPSSSSQGPPPVSRPSSESSKPAAQSGDNTLSSLSVQPGLLSPAFSPEKENYVVWLPYEVKSVEVNALAADKKAVLSVKGGENLLAGQDNEVLVVCTAENGKEKTYKIIVRRASNPEEAEEPEAPPLSRNSEELLSLLREKGEAGDLAVLFADFSTQRQPHLSASLLKELRKYPQMQLYITLSDWLTVGLSGLDAEEIPEKGIFLAPRLPAEKEGQAAALLPGTPVFSGVTGEDASLPMKLSWILKTDFAAGEKVRVYGFDSESGRFLLLREGLSVREGGFVSFEGCYSGELFVTPGELENALRPGFTEAEENSEAFEVSGLLLPMLIAAGAGILFVGALIGVLVCLLAVRRKKRIKQKADF